MDIHSLPQENHLNLGGINRCPSSNLIVAVTSFGLNMLCRGTDFSYRIDQADVLAWLAEHMYTP